MVTFLFDLDGTLIDSTEAILEGFAYAYHENGLPVPEDKAILSLIGHPLDYMFEYSGTPKEKVPDLIDSYKVLYREISNEKTTLLPHARESVALASEHGRLGVVTTKTSRYSRTLLDHLGILSFFEVLIGREDVIHPKPHPEPILKALHAMQSRPSRTWMIGDTCLDIHSANDAGVHSVAVTCGYVEEEKLLRCAKTVKPNTLEAVRHILRVA